MKAHTFGFLAIVSAFFFLVLPARGDITNGLVAHWTFDETQGSTAYDSAGINNGTIYGAQPTSGKLGGALSFDGTNDYVNVLDDISLRPQYITMSAWVKTPKKYEVIFTKSRYSDARYEQYSLCIWSDGRARSGIKRNSGGAPGVGWQISAGQTILNGTDWYLVTATWDGSFMKVYLNGQLEGVNSSVSSGPIDDYQGGNLKIGLNWSNDPAWFKGAMDDVRIYNRALNADEVQQLYNIPEPATMALFGLGVLILRRCRK
jgi:hypothetical protein